MRFVAAAPVGVGVERTLQLVPFQRSVNGSCGSFRNRLAELKPVIVQLVADAHEALVSTLSPDGSGLALTDHRRPFQRRTSGFQNCVLFLNPVVSPTATQL